MSQGPDNSILAALQIAETDASARIEAATVASSAQAAAEEQAATTYANATMTAATTESNARVQAAGLAANAQIVSAQTDASWHSSVASIEATAQTTVASTAGDAEVKAADARANATIQAANAAAAAQVSAATIDASWHQGVASTEASAQTTVAQTNAQAQVASAGIQASAQTTVATTNAAATVQAATIDASWHGNVASITANAQVQSAGIEASWHAGVAETEAEASNYNADQQLAGVNAHETAETYRLNLKLSFAEDKWNTLLPIIDEAVGSVASGSDSGSGGGMGFGAIAMPGPIMGFGGSMPTDDTQVGSYSRRTVRGPLSMGSGDVKQGGIGFASGSSVADAVAATQLPFIDTSGVLTPAQIQAQVNAAFARNDAKTASASLQLVNDMSGRGFSANSPILFALGVGLTGQSLRSSLQAETQIRIDSAKANADQVLNSQKAVSDQFIAQEGVLLEEQRNDVTRVVGILSAVSQLIGGAIS